MCIILDEKVENSLILDSELQGGSPHLCRLRTDCIQSPDERSLITSLNVIISSLSETMSESESFTILFYDNPLNFACRYIQKAVTAAMVTKNVCMSRRWKAELVAYGICLQPSPRFTNLLHLKPDRLPVSLENVQYLVLASKLRRYQTVHQNRPYK
jgi:hypothetical protein